LKAYKATHGDLLIPHKFVVPEGDVRFPVDTWGMKLGQNLMSIRCIGTFAEHRVKLEELGVNFEVEKIQHYDFLTHIYPALEAYKAVHGNLLVPYSFVVSEGDANYPADTWGMNLGILVCTIRNNGDHLKYKERLTALGFVYESVSDVQFDVIYSALQAYKAVHDNLLVPRKFIVPQDDVRFPADTWGMKLGHNVKNIRARGDYSEHRAKLEELGFVFKKNKKVVEI
jgi:Fe2+ transport system protein FeoA